MAKRTPRNQEGNERDYHPTPPAPVMPLLPHLLPGTRFIEPCAGNGALIETLQAHGHVCVAALDIEPQDACIAKIDALQWRRAPGTAYGQFMLITNPPWRRDLLHALIWHLMQQHPCWFLFDSDWAHTRQAVGLQSVPLPYQDDIDPKDRKRMRCDLLAYCHAIVSVGRVKWIADSKHQGFDNCAWYLFSRTPRITETPNFYGRTDT
jgi:hypothetical protein